MYAVSLFTVSDQLKNTAKKKKSLPIYLNPTCSCGLKPSELQKTLQASLFFSSTQRNCVYISEEKWWEKFAMVRGKPAVQLAKPLPKRKTLTDQLTCPRQQPESFLVTGTHPWWLTHGHAEESSFEQRKKNKCLGPVKADSQCKTNGWNQKQAKGIRSQAG